jgi:hypothetical protein
MKTSTRLLILFSLFLFLCLNNKSFSQEVSNISFKQEGAQVVISYDLSGNEGDLFNTAPFYSIDDGNTWTKLVTVKGDLLKVSPGTEKTIYWEVLKDVTGIKGSISFKVEAVKLKERVHDKTGFLIAGEIIGGKVGYIGKKWGINGTFFIFLPHTDRNAFYLSVTHYLISREKFRWNLGPSVGLADYYYWTNWDIHSSMGLALGLTNEFQFKKFYFNIDIFCSLAEEHETPIHPTLGIGIVF